MRRVGLTTAVWLLAMAFAPAAASAQEGGGAALDPPEAPPSEPRRIAVLVLATAGVDADTADSLSELAIGAIASRGGLVIVGKEEVQAVLGEGEARSIECVSSTACLGRIGVELRVDELVGGTISRQGDRWVFNLNRIDIRSGDLAGRVFQEVAGDVGAVADALSASIPRLFERPEVHSALVISASVEGAELFLDRVLVGSYRGEPVSVPDVTATRHEVRVRASGFREWKRTVNVPQGSTLQIEAELEPLRGARISPLVWLGLGVAAVAGGVAIGFGVASQGEVATGGTRAEAEEMVNQHQTEALVANIAIGVAAAGAVLAVVGLLVSDFDGESRDEAAAREAALPRGARAWLASMGGGR